MIYCGSDAELGPRESRAGPPQSLRSTRAQSKSGCEPSYISPTGSISLGLTRTRRVLYFMETLQGRKCSHLNTLGHPGSSYKVPGPPRGAGRRGRWRGYAFCSRGANIGVGGVETSCKVKCALREGPQQTLEIRGAGRLSQPGSQERCSRHCWWPCLQISNPPNPPRAHSRAFQVQDFYFILFYFPKWWPPLRRRSSFPPCSRRRLLIGPSQPRDSCSPPATSSAKGT